MFSAIIKAKVHYFSADFGLKQIGEVLGSPSLQYIMPVQVHVSETPHLNLLLMALSLPFHVSSLLFICVCVTMDE